MNQHTKGRARQAPGLAGKRTTLTDDEEQRVLIQERLSEENADYQALEDAVATLEAYGQDDVAAQVCDVLDGMVALEERRAAVAAEAEARRANTVAQGSLF